MTFIPRDLPRAGDVAAVAAFGAEAACLKPEPGQLVRGFESRPLRSACHASAADSARR
jgi:hypothetical protein